MDRLHRTSVNGKRIHRWKDRLMDSKTNGDKEDVMATNATTIRCCGVRPSWKCYRNQICLYVLRVLVLK